MAARYWVGGAGTWSSTNTANWSSVSGGAGGASVPTSADNVTFDTNSGTGVVTFTNGGVTVGSVTLNTSGITLSLGAAFSCGALFILLGTFTTNNYNVTATALASDTSNARTINLGSSTVSLSSTTPITFTNSTNLTFNAGASLIRCISSSAAFAGGGNTFNDVSFTTASSLTLTVQGSNTFNNLSVAGRTSTGVTNFVVAANQTVNGTLTLSAGTTAAMRTFVYSDVVGTSRTLTCAAVSATDIDFRDITIAGAAAPLSGTRLGDCKGNSGITFPAPKTVYYRQTGSASWGATGTGSWAATNGGAFDATMFPLAQDTAVFPSATYPASGAVTTINAAYNIGTIDMSARTTNTMTLSAAASGSAFIHGDWITGTGITFSGAAVMTFAGRSSQKITSAGRTFTYAITVNSPGGSVTLQDAYTSSNNTVTALNLISGTFDASIYNVTFSAGSSGFNAGSSSVSRTVNIGSGTWVIAGLGAWNASPSTNLTVTGTGTVSLTSASTKTFAGGGIQTYPTLNQGGAGTLTVSGSNKFANLTNTTFARIQFTGGTTNTFDSFSINGIAGTLLPLGSTNTTQAILKKPTAWNVGANSTNSGNNTGLSFTAGGNDYLNISYINGQLSATVYAATVLESGTGTDAFIAGLAYLGAVLETANTTDVFVASAQYRSDVSEAATGTEQITSAAAYSGSVVELGTGADAFAGVVQYLSTVFETGAATETAAAQTTVTGVVAETSASADTMAASSTLPVAVLENVTGVDATAAQSVALAAITEAGTAADSNTSVAVLVSAVAENGSGADAPIANLAANSAVAETAAGTDANSAVSILPSNILEHGLVSDMFEVSASYSASLIETAAQTDSIVAGLLFGGNIFETATTSELLSAALVVTPSVLETASAAETFTVTAAYRTFVAETAAATTTVIPNFTYNAVVLAVAQALDSTTPAGSTYNVSVVSAAAAADSMVGGFLWSLINDAENANWQNVITSQTVSWGVANAAQTPSWQNVDSAQTDGWASVDDSQNPNWQNIKTIT